MKPNTKIYDRKSSSWSKVSHLIPLIDEQGTRRKNVVAIKINMLYARGESGHQSDGSYLILGTRPRKMEKEIRSK